MKPIRLLSICLCLFFVTCTKDNNSSVQIRIENISQSDFTDVYADTSGGTHDFGDVKAGHTSDYASFDMAYRYAYIQLKVGTQVYTLQPIDYVGETPLEEGNYTYAIDVVDPNSEYGLGLELKVD